MPHRRVRTCVRDLGWLLGDREDVGGIPEGIVRRVICERTPPHAGEHLGSEASAALVYHSQDPAMG